MVAIARVNFSFPVEVSLRVTSVTTDWIEGDLEIKVSGVAYKQHFKVKNNVEQDFQIPSPIDARLHVKLYLENPKKVCADGYIEKVIIVPIQVPFHVCEDI